MLSVALTDVEKPAKPQSAEVRFGVDVFCGIFLPISGVWPLKNHLKTGGGFRPHRLLHALNRFQNIEIIVPQTRKFCLNNFGCRLVFCLKYFVKFAKITPSMSNESV